ncbi:MAG TPA: hypothetical protein VLM37_10635 [Fibrobacteraceae bacterium]|nr:hypothetical protein [Fibrobacteraceae bacterium]
MQILAQHGYGEGEKVSRGLEHGLLDGVVIGPKNIRLSALKGKIDGWEKNSPQARILFDPQYYATVVAQEEGARLGYLVSDYSDYFSPKTYKDLRRERNIRDELNKALSFQLENLKLSEAIVPGIMIQDGLHSESSSIAKNFLEIGAEEAKESGNDAFLTLALGQSCFREMSALVDFVDEVTGFDLPVKGIYLLVETSRHLGANPWYIPEILKGRMYLNYAFAQAGFEVINGFSMFSSPFLSAVGATGISCGWFDTLRYFSLDPFRASVGGGHRPNRRYLSKALWSRLDLATIAPDLGRNHWIMNEYSGDSRFESGEADECDEALQHWHALQVMSESILNQQGVSARLQFLWDSLNQAEIHRSHLPALSLPKFKDQIDGCRTALRGFCELAELPLSL